jgi:hypothetical protein
MAIVFVTNRALDQHQRRDFYFNRCYTEQHNLLPVRGELWYIISGQLCCNGEYQCHERLRAL